MSLQNDATLDLSAFTPKERELLVGLASSLMESRDVSGTEDPVARLWRSYAAKSPAVPNQAEADKLALEAVAETRGRL